MHKAPELTNLLPVERVRALRRTYFVRLGVVFVWLLAVMVVINIVMLAPTYLLAHQEVETQQKEVDRLGAGLAGSEEQAVNARVKTLATASEHLVTLGKAPTASAVIATITRLPRPGISLTGFTYSAPAQSNPARLSVIGVAVDRDSLRRYVSTLSSQPYVTSADLPISAYAKEANIDFSIVLTGSLIPSAL